MFLVSRAILYVTTSPPSVRPLSWVYGDPDISSLTPANTHASREIDTKRPPKKKKIKNLLLRMKTFETHYQNRNITHSMRHHSIRK